MWVYVNAQGLRRACVGGINSLCISAVHARRCLHYMKDVLMQTCCAIGCCVVIVVSVVLCFQYIIPVVFLSFAARGVCYLCLHVCVVWNVCLCGMCALPYAWPKSYLPPQMIEGEFVARSKLQELFQACHSDLWVFTQVRHGVREVIDWAVERNLKIVIQHATNNTINARHHNTQLYRQHNITQHNITQHSTTQD